MELLLKNLSCLFDMFFLRVLVGKFLILLYKFFTKKILCVFLIGIMLFNGFVPKSQEVKNNFFIALSCVVHSAVFEVFSQCTETMTVISNKIAHDLFELFMAQTGSTKSQNEQNSDKQQPVPANTSTDSGIINERNFSEQSQFNIVKTTVSYVSYIAVNDLFRLYNNIKVYDDGNFFALFVLLILLFAIYTTRIKDVIKNILKIKYVIEPACI